jgi:protein TonB
MDKNFKPPKPREMFAQEPLSVRIRKWRPNGLQTGMLVSLVFHAGVVPASLVIWTILFGPIDFSRAFQDTPLEVILVNARTTEAPTKAQAIAQANLAGGGEADQGRATSPLPPSPTLSAGDNDATSEKSIEQMQQMQQQILANLRRELALMPIPDPTKPMMTPQEHDREEQRQQKLRTLAEIEKRINEENARPKKRYISPATREAAYAAYVDALRRKIEVRGTENFPESAGKKLYGELTMMVTVNHDGSILATDIVEGSGDRTLDRRAQAIVRSIGSFGKFTDAMRRQTDQIVLPSRFKFTRDETLETQLSSRQ